jgi:hypothetical protein
MTTTLYFKAFRLRKSSRMVSSTQKLIFGLAKRCQALFLGVGVGGELQYITGFIDLHLFGFEVLA